MDRATNGFRATMRDIIFGVAAVGSSLIGAVSQAGINELTPLGPEGGRIFEVEFNRNSPDVIYVTTPAGLHRSTDGGASWQLTQPLVLEPLERSDIAVDPNDSNHIYVATAHNSIFISEDGGLTFTDASLPGGRKRHVMTGSDGVVYAPDETGMYRSDDRGHSWVRAGSFPQSGSDLNSNFAVDPSDARVVYASLFNQGLFVSRDAGASWQLLPAQMMYNQTLSIDVDPTNPLRLWIASYDGIYRSDNGGVSWTPARYGWTARVVIDPHDPMTVYASPSSSEPVWRTTNGGATWSSVSQDFGSLGAHEGMAVHPTAAGRLIGYGNGLWLSADSGAHWTRASVGLSGATIQGIVPMASAAGYYVSTVNGIYALDGNNTFRALNNDALANLAGLLRSPSVFNVVATSTGATETLIAYLDYAQRLVRSVDGGAQWSLLPLPAGTQWMRSPVLSPGAQPTLYVATQVGVFSSTNFGDTWTSQSVGLPPIVNQVLTTSDPQVLYAEARPDYSTATSLYRSNDGAQTWTVTAFPPSTTVFGINTLAVHPTDPRVVIVSAQEGFFRTTDGGATWTKTSTLVGNPSYYSIAFDARHPNLVYAGGPKLLRSVDGGASWQQLLSPENYYAQGMRVFADPTQDDALLIGTINTGLHQLAIRPDLQVRVNAPATANTTRVDFTVDVTNRSVFPARDVRITLQFPAVAGAPNATVANGSCSLSGAQVVCTIASLPNESTVNIPVSSSASAAGAYVLQASVTAAEADANTANNSATGQVNVMAAPPMTGGGGGGGGGGAMSPLFLLALVGLLFLNEVRGRILFALIATFGFAVTSSAAEAPTIERTGDWRVNVRKFAEANLKHPAWGASHSTRDYELAKELAAADHVTLDDDVLYAASYLHDVAAFAPFAKAGVDHQDEAARVVESLLEGTGFPMAKIEAVRGAIRTHMFGRDPVGPEAIYLHDADALDWLGAIGVARIIGLVDPNGGTPDGPMVMKRLESNLANVPSRIVSNAGKARTPERVRELEAFLRNLRKQTADFKTL